MNFVRKARRPTDVRHRFPQILGLCTLLQDLPLRGERDGLPLHPGPWGQSWSIEGIGIKRSESIEGLEGLSLSWVIA